MEDECLRWEYGRMLSLCVLERRQWSHNPEYRAAYEELGPEFDLARVLIEARIGAKLTQAQLAERMETTQSVIALSQASEDQDCGG